MSEQTRFTGWPILIGCFILMFCMLGGVQTFAVFIAPIMSETGFSLGAVAMMSTLATIGSFVGNMLFSRIFKILGAKWLMVICALICAGYFFGTSYSRTLFGMYTAMAIGGFATGVGTIAPLSVIMTNWFIKKRATYMSIVIAGSMFGGALLMPVSGFLVEMFDWRVAFRILGLGIGIVSVLTSLFVIVESPAQKGQQAYGAGDTSSAETRAANAEAQGGVTAKEARGSLSFWLLIIGVLFIGCSTNIGSFTGMFQLGIALSNPIISSLHKVSGGYQLPFIAMAALNVVAFVMIITALKIAPYRRESQPLQVPPLKGAQPA